MRQLAKGSYKTRAGHDAIVGKVRAKGMVFHLIGVIQDLESGAWHLHTWTLDGQSLAPPPHGQLFDLIPQEAA